MCWCRGRLLVLGLVLGRGILIGGLGWCGSYWGAELVSVR